MSLSFCRMFLISLSLLLTFSHLVHSLPTPTKVAPNPQLLPGSPDQSGRTLDMVMNAMSSMSLIPNLRSLFNLSGTRYEWIPLGSYIFGNSLGGQSTNKNN